MICSRYRAASAAAAASTAAASVAVAAAAAVAMYRSAVLTLFPLTVKQCRHGYLKSETLVIYSYRLQLKP